MHITEENPEWICVTTTNILIILSEYVPKREIVWQHLVRIERYIRNLTKSYTFDTFTVMEYNDIRIWLNPESRV